MSAESLPSILVVDDTPANLQVMRRLLRSIECEVVEASDGNEALARFLEREYALIILDVHMPGMDGYEVASLMREDVDSPRTPIIFVTAAYSDEVHRDRGYESGAVDYLAKPIEPSILLAKVRVFLELYAAKRELQGIRDNLERVVGMRTAELRASLQVAERLRNSAERALEKAERATAVRTRFLSRISHELRTPLNGILGLLQLMERDNLSPSQLDCISGIESSANNLMVALNEALDFSQITTGGVVAQPTILNLRALLQEVADVIGQLAREKGLGFEADLDGCERGYVRVDGGMLRRILLAIGQNAVKFSSSGTVRFQAEGIREDGDLRLRVSLRDEGIGIPADQHDHIFEGFSQVDESTTRSTGGIGLGLAVARELADAIGAELGLESEPGAGSTFWLVCRLKTANAAAQEALEQAGAPETMQFGPLRVLVAEDNKVNQQVACGMLRKLGVESEVANDGAEAVEKFTPGAYGLVLMDLDMPRMDGFQATREIRAIEAREAASPPVHIIALTANLAAETRQRCIDSGMDDYLGKPVRLQQLQDMIRHHQVLRGYE